MRSENIDKNHGWYICRRELDSFLRDIFGKNHIQRLIAEWILLKKPMFKDGAKLKEGEVIASYKNVCKEFPGAITESTLSRIMNVLEKHNLISRYRRGNMTITKSLIFKKSQDLSTVFSLKNMQVVSLKSESSLAETCKTISDSKDIDSNDLHSDELGICKKNLENVQVVSLKSASTYGNKEYNNKEEGEPPLSIINYGLGNKKNGEKSNKGEGKSKDKDKSKGEETMDMRTAITPKEVHVRVRTEKRQRREFNKDNPLPTSKSMAEGWKHPNSLIRAFTGSIKAKYPDVDMGSEKFSWLANTESAAKAIDWIRDEVYRNNSIGEAEIRAVAENWIEWYVSNKIDSKYRHKRSVLNMQSFFESRFQYYSAKDSNDMLIQRSKQRKVAVAVKKKTIMESFDGMYELAKINKRSVMDSFLPLALASKGIVLTCLYLDYKKLTTNAVEMVSKVLSENQKTQLGRNLTRTIYAETWRYRTIEIVKKIVPFSDWETVFGKYWNDIAMLDKKEGNETDHLLATEFFYQLSDQTV